jgi:putative two-component system response regulator
MADELHRATIMVVDDTPANLKLLGQMLQGQGCRVLAFPQGQMALKAAGKTPPDLILLDINMPDLNGFEVCQRLKADPALRDIPVIFISALTDTADKVRAFAAGGVDFVTKPFQFEEVNARVATHLRLRYFQAELETNNRQLAALVKEKVKEISDSQLATIHALSKLAESRDDETGEHIERTQNTCRVLAEELARNPRYEARIDRPFVDNLFHAAPLHDVGKVGIVDSILLKPGALTREEFEIMKTHASLGANTLMVVHNKYPRNAFLKMGIAVARSHHERWDGSGYPDGLVGERIPLSARIMAVADVYDALRSRRPYKPGFAHDRCVKIITEGSGKHFDPGVVEAFLAVEAALGESRSVLDLVRLPQESQVDQSQAV